MKKPDALRRPTLLLAVIFCTMGASCLDKCNPFDPSDCGGSTETKWALAEPIHSASYSVNNGEAHFRWSRVFTGLCVGAADRDNKMSFTLFYDINASPSNVHFTGSVFHTAGVKPYSSTAAPMFASLEPNVLLFNVENIGLKQGNPDSNVAEVDVELDMVFNSGGDQTTDTSRALAFLSRFDNTLYYRQPK